MYVDCSPGQFCVAWSLSSIAIKNPKARASDMAQQVRALGTEPDYLGVILSIPETHMVAGENQFWEVVLSPALHIHKYIG